MKYLKRFNQINEGYDYRMFQDETKKGDEIDYYFNDEFGNQFKVNFEFTDEESCIMLYQVFDTNIRDWSFNIVKTNIYKVFETVFKEILNDFISNNKWCEIVEMVGLGKKVEKEEISKRTKIYINYLTNNPIKGWELSNDKNTIYLTKIKT
jgi:hypothetical protein